MRTFCRLVVLTVCISLLLSLFGCNKGKTGVLDGSGMERALWSEFTISQSSDVYEDNFLYTVKYDETLGTAHFYTEVPHETKGYPILKSTKLKSKDVETLINMDIMSFTDESPELSEFEAEILDGTFLKFSVTDSNGNVLKKVISNKQEKEILDIIRPYADKLKKQ